MIITTDWMHSNHKINFISSLILHINTLVTFYCPISLQKTRVEFSTNTISRDDTITGQNQSLIQLFVETLSK